MSRKVKRCANPLFEKWITEWRDEAIARNRKTKYSYTQALKSLQKYPLPLKSGREAKILEYFGDKICTMLDEKLESHRQENGDEEMESDNEILAIVNTQSRKKTNNTNGLSPTKKHIYIPRRRSGGYALLIALCRNNLRNDDHVYMSKAELLVEAQPFCDASFTKPDAGSFYTAWASMGSLIKKGLVLKEGHPPKYSLTASGAETAAKILKGEEKFSNGGNCPSQSASSHTTQSESTDYTTVSQQLLFDEFTLLPGEFEIILCVDNAETLGASSDRRKAVQTGLKKNGVNFDVRKLHVGDFLWVAREKVKPLPGSLQLPHSRELVLDYIIERKRKDDLAQSIMDGRFKEQKHRLKSCGLTRPIYLVEEFGKKDNFGIPSSSLQQAVTNTQIIDGFTIKNTKDSNASIDYLTQMTRQLQQCYSSKILTSFNIQKGSRSMQTFDSEHVELLSFEEFNRNSMKNKPLSVEETFAKQLLKLHGLSTEKVAAILSVYPTPACLYEAFSKCRSSSEGINVLANIKWGKSERNLGPAIAQALYQLYTMDSFI